MKTTPYVSAILLLTGLSGTAAEVKPDWPKYKWAVIGDSLSDPRSATYMAVPWLHPDWFFEPIHWAHGCLSWGGSKSVHHCSRFGRLHFTGVDAKSTAAVKRHLNPMMDLVKADMSDADAAGADAMNIKYLVSLKRTQWLKAKRLKD